MHKWDVCFILQNALKMIISVGSIFMNLKILVKKILKMATKIHHKNYATSKETH